MRLDKLVGHFFAGIDHGLEFSVVLIRNMFGAFLHMSLQIGVFMVDILELNTCQALYDSRMVAVGQFQCAQNPRCHAEFVEVIECGALHRVDNLAEHTHHHVLGVGVVDETQRHLPAHSDGHDNTRE